MSAFLHRLRVDILLPHELDGGARQLYQVVEDFAYDSDLLGRVEVKAGFVTDFASIPRAAWRYIDPEDPCILMPSVLHDWEYTRQRFAREQCDLLLREAMRTAGARWDQQALVYRLVRAFGGSHWLPPKPPSP